MIKLSKENKWENYDLIKDVLLDDKNPFLRHYNEGLYNLDSWDEYLGIIANPYNQEEDYLDYQECVKFVEYLKQHIVAETICIGEYCFFQNN